MRCFELSGKSTRKRSEMPKIFIVLLVAVLFLSGCGREVLYEEVLLTQTPEKVRIGFEDLLAGSTGLAEIGDDAYAIIVGETGQEIEMISVSKKFDVHYRIIKSSTTKSERPIKIVKFENHGSPVGFKKVN
jgi:hypothetical protein